MPRPVSRRELIRRLRALGWTGPHTGGEHEHMRHPTTRVKLTLPNPHHGDLDWSLVKRILAQAGIDPETWSRFE